jgi:hypothetical protein
MVSWDGKIVASDGRIWQTLGPAAGLALSHAFGSSESEIWGFDGSGGELQLRHWNGTSWSSMEAPASASAPPAQLEGWSNGPSDAWLVATEWPGPQPSAHVLHWDGSTWSNHADMSDAVLYSVWGSAKGDLWVGGSRVSGSRRSSLLMRWDGKAWSTAYEGPGHDLLDQGGYAWVAGSDRENVWAMTLEFLTGTTRQRLLRWNGSAFGQMLEGTVENMVLVATGQQDAWLVGGGKEALHFDGRSWTASSPLQATSGPDGPLQTSVPGFGAVYVSYEGAVYVNRSSEQKGPPAR